MESNTVLIGRVIGKATNIVFKAKLSPSSLIRPGNLYTIIQKNGEKYVGMLRSVESSENYIIGKFTIIGEPPTLPFFPGDPIYELDKETLEKRLKLDTNNFGKVFLGFLRGTKFKILVDIEKLLRYHFSIFAKTGAGKTYLASVIVEDLMNYHVPILIIDPHGEYNSLRYLRDLGLSSFARDIYVFDEADKKKFQELINDRKTIIFDLRGKKPREQSQILCELVDYFFYLAKNRKILPFLLLVEEAHNFAPERSFGYAPSTESLRTVASEGRKFGLSLCLISQRPARVDKSVLSQIGTQFILQMTDKRDIEAVIKSAEGLNREYFPLIQTLNIGEAVISGRIVEYPLIVKVRERTTFHGNFSSFKFISPQISKQNETKNNKISKRFKSR